MIKQEKQTNKTYRHRQQREEGLGLVKDKRDQIYGYRRMFNFGLWARNAKYRWHITDLYSWNLDNFINQCHANKFNEKKTHSLKGTFDKHWCWRSSLRFHVFLVSSRYGRTNSLVCLSTLSADIEAKEDNYQQDIPPDRNQFSTIAVIPSEFFHYINVTSLIIFMTSSQKKISLTLSHYDL